MSTFQEAREHYSPLCEVYVGTCPRGNERLFIGELLTADRIARPTDSRLVTTGGRASQVDLDISRRVKPRDEDGLVRIARRHSEDSRVVSSHS